MQVGNFQGWADALCSFFLHDDLHGSNAEEASPKCRNKGTGQPLGGAGEFMWEAICVFLLLSNATRRSCWPRNWSCTAVDDDDDGDDAVKLSDS